MSQKLLNLFAGALIGIAILFSAATAEANDMNRTTVLTDQSAVQAAPVYYPRYHTYPYYYDRPRAYYRPYYGYPYAYPYAPYPRAYYYYPRWYPRYHYAPYGPYGFIDPNRYNYGYVNPYRYQYKRYYQPIYPWGY
jgi:hypothetical protein